MLKVLSVTLGVFVVHAIGVGLHADLIVNGDFQTGDFQGWTASGNVVVFDYAANFNRLDTSPNGAITQSFSTSPGTEYELKFEFGVYTGHSRTQTLQVEVVGANVLLSEFVSDPNWVSNAPISFEQYVYTFFADSSLTTLAFRDVSTNYTFSTDSVLDNISVSSVPEPSSLGLVVIAGIISATQRRRLRSRERVE